jgi:hypothetical protein
VIRSQFPIYLLGSALKPQFRFQDSNEIRAPSLLRNAFGRSQGDRDLTTSQARQMNISAADEELSPSAGSHIDRSYVPSSPLQFGIRQ